MQLLHQNCYGKNDRFALFGLEAAVLIVNTARVLEIAMRIYKGNIPALQAAIAAGWDIEDGIVIKKYTTFT